jgi:3-methyladenine DNA glycosylase Tag
MELFRKGPNSDLSRWLSLAQFDSYHMLVNKAISQEDAMKRAQVVRKRKANSMPNNAQLRKFHMVQNTPPDFQQALHSGRWTKQSKDRSQEIVKFPNPQRQTP